MKKLLFLVSLIAFSGVSQAAEEGGLFVEPMLTWERGRGDVNFPAPFSNAETELDGFGVGLRFGGHVYQSVFLGVDGRYSMPTFKDDKLKMDTDAKSWNVGPVVGIQMPTTIALRVWAGWVVGGEVDTDKDKEVDAKFKSGQGYRVGAGVKLGFASLNIEYQNIKYDDTVLQEVGIFTPNTTRGDVELSNESMVLSVSFPVAI